MVFTNPLPYRLKEARLRANISQKNLGIQIGLEPSSASGRMNHYEKGRHIPDLQTLKRISEKLGVPLNYFFCEDKVTAELIIEISKLDENKKIELIKNLRSLDKY